MIDCHVHAYPDFATQATRLMERLPRAIQYPLRHQLLPRLGTMGSTLGRIATRLTLPQRFKGALDIEGVASLQEKIPAALYGPLELVSSLALLPQIAVFGTVERLLDSMEQNGIEQAVVIGAAAVASNEWLLEEAWPKAKDRIIPVTTLPELPANASQQEWTAAFQSLARAGARGFKIHPNMDGLPLAHPAYRALFEVAKAQKRFVIVHTGCFDVLGYRQSGALALEELKPLLDDHREVRVCLAHMNREHPEQAWQLMEQHEQLFADTSWQPARVVERALKRVGASRLLLGSDWPLLHSDLQKDALEILTSAASADDFEQVSRKSAQTFLGLS